MMDNPATKITYRRMNEDKDNIKEDDSVSISSLVPNRKKLKKSNAIYNIFKYSILMCLIVIFVLGTYVLYQSTLYFKSTLSNHQQHIEESLKSFELDIKQQFKSLNIMHKSIQEELENISELRENSSKSIQDLFSFTRKDLYNDNIDDSNIQKCDIVPINLRFDCHPENGASELSCAERGCCWSSLHQLKLEKNVPLDVPYCYYPKNWALYSYKNFSKDGNDFQGSMHLKRNSFYKNDLSLIQIETISLDDSVLRVKISDPVNKRYEPPIPSRAYTTLFSKSVVNPQYKLSIDENLPGFKVVRENDKRILFDSIGVGGFIFADQFLQISSILPSHYIYGLGEHRTNLKLNTNWQKLTLFNSDQPPTENANLYGSHPFYMVIEKSGKAHGVLFLNSNAMDVILQPTPAITFRSIGGIFDIYFFLGPTPSDVLKQYSQIVGKPFFPPYWSLGFHLCRFGYGSLNNTKAVWKRTRDALIPFDTQWNDLDYMDKNNDFTYDKKKFKDLPKFIKNLHDAGMHYIPLIDAGVSASEENGTYVPYDEGVRRGIFIRESSGNEPFKGKVWNLNSTAWPDFTHPESKNYYIDMLSNMHNEFQFDGAWLDMNEPSNFYNGHSNGCKENKFDNPPYLPISGNVLSKKTVCMNAEHHLGYHYNIHNTYGTSHSIVTNHALRKIRNKRPFIISRSTWEGHGAFAGHWTGDVYSSWHDLKMSVPEVLTYSLFQIPMVGADICGFDGNTTESLCNRWMQLGAFYPFSRNHNSDDTIEQDPVAMGQLVVRSSLRALRTRYNLLPYLYTLFYKAHLYGETVARPLFIEFHNDPMTYSVDTQFLWGSCLMIVPVLEEGKTEVHAYIPRGLWYDYYTKKNSFSIGRNYSLPAPLDIIPLMVRGGCILPVQEPSVTTTSSRRKPFGLLVALNETERAEGELYWDDGDSLDSIETRQYKLFKFEVSNDKLTSTIVDGDYKMKVKLGRIIIMGISKIVRQVVINNNNDVKFEYDKEKMALEIDNLSVNFTKNFIVTWSYRTPELEVTTSVPLIESSTLRRVDNFEKKSVVSSGGVSVIYGAYFKLIFNYMLLKYCITFYEL